jgi:hypothetical protein
MSNGEGVLLPEQRLSSECKDDVAELARLLRVPVEAAAILFSTGFNQCRERAKEALRAYGEQCRAQGVEGCERDAASWRALQQLKQEGVACNAIPKHEWELVGDLEAVPVNYGYSIRATHGWEQCKRCGLKRHFTRDPGTAHADTLTGREGGG